MTLLLYSLRDAIRQEGANLYIMEIHLTNVLIHRVLIYPMYFLFT